MPRRDRGAQGQKPLRVGGFALAAIAFAFAIACGGKGRSVTAPQPTTAFAGFDIGIFPGTAALQAWKYPASPYRWVSFYLAAPCHRDSTYAGKLPTITSNGWGVAAIYVGQQDWANAANRITGRRVATPSAAPADTTAASATVPSCSASLLSGAKGTAEAADAVAKLRSEGFPDGSTVFLDVELVTTVSQPLLDYYRAWMLGVLNDGHYKPGVYAGKLNAPILYAVPLATPTGSAYTPAFWVASSGELSATSRPSDVGLAYAQIWQAVFESMQQFNGFSLQIDANVATKASPSSP
jgi:hypothetical protein